VKAGETVERRLVRQKPSVYEWLCLDNSLADDSNKLRLWSGFVKYCWYDSVVYCLCDATVCYNSVSNYLFVRSCSARSIVTLCSWNCRW